MGNRIVLCFMILAVVALYHRSAMPQGEADAPGIYYLELSSVGLPTGEKETSARKIAELFLFGHKLYIGHGDATVNTGPTDVISYGLDTGEYLVEFTVDDEGIRRYRVLDGKLVIPGLDATGDWDYGNIYVKEQEGWVKRRTIPHGLHVFDAVSYSGKWYASTGCYFKLGGEVIFPFGGIFESEDEGKSWKLVFSTPTRDGSVFRISSIAPFHKKLYCFNYAYRGVKPEDVPKKYRKYLGKTYGGEHLIFEGDPFGEIDCVTYDGSRWEWEDILDLEDVCLVSPFVFRDKLLMSVLQGRYVDYSRLKNGLPGNAEMGLYAFDGEAVEKVPLDFEMIKDIVPKEEVLLLLLLKDGRYYIGETRDLKVWRYYYLPTEMGVPKSIEHDGEYFYVGTEDGNIFRQSGITNIHDPSYAVGRAPRRICVSAILPRDGRACWAAITNWRKWGKVASLTLTVKAGNIIEVTTDNVSSFEVFVPASEIDTSGRMSLIIDGKRAYRGGLRGKSSLSCEFTKWGNWKVRKGTATAEGFEYSKMFVGRATARLGREGDDPPLGLWLADVIRWSASAELALSLRGKLREDLEEGDVALEDLFDLTYKSYVCTFKADGKRLERMLEFNLNQPSPWNLCGISGCSIKYETREGGKIIVKSSLEPEREYVIALPEYLAKDAEKILGEKIEYSPTPTLLTDAMLNWFEKFKTVGKIGPRMVKLPTKERSPAGDSH